VNSPQPVGTTVTWTAAVTDTDAGAFDYQFSVRLSGGDYSILRDFATINSFKWTPSEREGDFDIRVVARNLVTGEAGLLEVSYSVTSRVTGETPVVSATANPLVALYSAPPCDAGGSMRVRFWRTGDFTSQTTPWKSCLTGLSRNFYVAGMRPVTAYSMRQEFSDDPSAPVAVGPTLSFTTGSLPTKNFNPPASSALTPSAGDTGQDVLLHALLNRAAPPFITATNLSGALVWYYADDTSVQYATRPVEGGTILLVRDSQKMLREIDLAGNPVRETTLQAISEQLMARGANPITSFHHEARRLPDGKTVVLAGTERVLSDVQGPGPVAVVGEMIVVLDENWRVVWHWDSFEHLDVTRKALGNEKCPQFCITPSTTANDWTHANAIGYSPADGNLLLSIRHQAWVVKIDYEDGAGDGDVLWRLGKDGDFTIDSDDPYPWFSYQHDADYVPGDPNALALFDNGNLRQTVSGVTHNSRGQVLNLDEVNKTATLQLNADLGVYSGALGSAQKLTGGNFHFEAGFLGNAARSVETRPDGSPAFVLQTQNLTYRSFRMRDLYTPGAPAGEDQTISFDAVAAQTFGTTFDLGATATSGLPVGFRVVSGPATLDGNTLTFTGAGSVVVQADQDGNIRYNPAPFVRQTIAVDKAEQTITFGTLADRTFGDAPFAPAAAASSNLVVGFAAEGQCTFTNGQVNITGAGSCTITASQAGDANYNAASNVQRSFQISKANSTTTVNVTDATYDGLPHGGTANATGVGGLDQSLSVTYSGRNATAYGPSTSVPVNAGDYTASATFAGDANHAGGNDSKDFQIAKANQTITFNALADKRFGDAPFALSASSSSGLTVTLSVVSGPATLGGGMLTLDGAGAVTVRASQGGDANYGAAAAVERTFDVAKASQTITFGPPTDRTYGDPDFTLGATASSGLAVTFAAAGQCGVSGNTVHITGAGSCTVTASQAGSGNYSAAVDVARTFQIAKASQTTTFGALANRTFGDPDFALSAGVSSGLAVSFSASGTCTLSGNTVHINGAGSCTITASQSGNINFLAATDVARSFNVAKAIQTINITAHAPSSAAYDSRFTVAATGGGSGNPVTYAAAGSCSNSGATFTLTAGTGTCTVTYSQTGSANYEAAQATETVTAVKATQTITFNAPLDKTYGDADFQLTASASSGLSPSFAATGACTIAGSTVHINGAGSCTVIASQSGDANYNAATSVQRSFTISKAGSTTAVTVADATYDGLPHGATATASGVGGLSQSLAVTYSGRSATAYGPSATAPTNAGDYTASATFAGDQNHAGGGDSTDFRIAKATQSITFNALSNKTFGDAPFALSASSSSGLPVSFAVVSGPATLNGGTLTLDGAGAVTVRASQAGDGNYGAAAAVERTFDVAKAAQAISFGPLTDRTYGDPDFTLSASVPSGLAVTFAAAGNCTASGATVHIGGAGSCTVTASQAGDSNHSAAANVSRSFQVAKATTSLALASSAMTLPAGQTLTFTANVTSAAGVPTGSVQFKVDGTNAGIASSLNASGAATFTTSALTAGAHSVTAEYGGDANFKTATGTLASGQVVGGLFEFVQSVFAVNERDGSVAVTVRRMGDASQAAWVEYATDDGGGPSVTVPCSAPTGAALERCDYTHAQGLLQFAPGETEKTFTVLVNSDSYTEGVETIRVRLSNPAAGTALGEVASAAIEITDDTRQTWNPLAATEFFVRQHYADFLSREPDAAGLQFWTNEIESCGASAQCREVKRVNVSAAFFLSIEFQQTGYLSYRAHKAAFGNLAGRPVPVTRDEMLADVRVIGKDLIVNTEGWELKLEQNKRAYFEGFVSSARFTSLYPQTLAPEQFVDALNVNSNGALSQSERDALVNDLKNNAKTRAQVLRAVAEDADLSKAELNKAFVLTQYFGYLRRDPDAAPDADFVGWQFWLGKLNEFDGNYVEAEMVKAFLDSTEYRNRFGQ